MWGNRFIIVNFTDRCVTNDRDRFCLCSILIVVKINPFVRKRLREIPLAILFSTRRLPPGASTRMSNLRGTAEAAAGAPVGSVVPLPKLKKFGSVSNRRP